MGRKSSEQENKLMELSNINPKSSEQENEPLDICVINPKSSGQEEEAELKVAMIEPQPQQP